MGGGALHLTEIFLHKLRAAEILFGQIGHVDDGVHRRAKVVGHVEKEGALGAAGLLGPVQSLRELAGMVLFFPQGRELPHFHFLDVSAGNYGRHGLPVPEGVRPGEGQHPAVFAVDEPLIFHSVFRRLGREMLRKKILAEGRAHLVPEIRVGEGVDKAAEYVAEGAAGLKYVRRAGRLLYNGEAVGGKVEIIYAVIHLVYDLVDALVHGLHALGFQPQELFFVYVPDIYVGHGPVGRGLKIQAHVHAQPLELSALTYPGAVFQRKTVAAAAKLVQKLFLPQS